MLWVLYVFRLFRNPKYKITKAVALAGSVTSAFEDVDTGDQDFDSIQGNVKSLLYGNLGACF